jgi:hypothetical protein
MVLIYWDFVGAWRNLRVQYPGAIHDATNREERRENMFAGGSG